LKANWSDTPAEARSHCDKVARFGGTGSYTMLQACIQQGSLSGIGNDSRYLQFTAPVQPGNSGGPLVDVNGLIVGVVSTRLADIEMLKASGSLPQNVNFAIRGDLATGFLRANGIAPVTAEPKRPLSASAIASNAQAYTVQVVCQSHEL